LREDSIPKIPSGVANLFVLESSPGEQKWEHWHALLGLARQNRMLWTEWVNRNINKLQFNYELKANNITEINKEQQISDNCVINGFKAGALLKPERTQKRGNKGSSSLQRKVLRGPQP
jgi:hypothetical protein